MGSQLISEKPGMRHVVSWAVKNTEIDARRGYKKCILHRGEELWCIKHLRLLPSPCRNAESLKKDLDIITWKVNGPKYPSPSSSFLLPVSHSLYLALSLFFSRVRISPEFRLLTTYHRPGKTYEFNHY